MRRKFTWRDVLGLIKDKASLSKAALLSKSSSVVRATTHSHVISDRRISYLLHQCNGSRTTASALIAALIDRLNRTSNCFVALKCLFVVHHIIKCGSFILQGQLSVFPSNGGYNYLKLSAFRDTGAMWALSAWVHWYASYLETLLTTCRVLGYFFCKENQRRQQQQQRMTLLMNANLIKEVDILVASIEEICKVPDPFLVEDNNKQKSSLLKEIMALLYTDYLSLVSEVSSRLIELKERLSCLSLSDSIELASCLKRLQCCRESLSVLYVIRRPSILNLWNLVQELRDTNTIENVQSRTRRRE